MVSESGNSRSYGDHNYANLSLSQWHTPITVMENCCMNDGSSSNQTKQLQNLKKIRLLQVMKIIAANKVFKCKCKNILYQMSKQTCTYCVQLYDIEVLDGMTYTLGHTNVSVLPGSKSLRK